MIIAGVLCFYSLSAQQTFRNPVIHGDMADPSIIRIGETYYATGTSSEWAPFYPLFKSSDLINWKQVGHLFNEQPEWTKSSFWAPELFYHNNKIYAYYTARRKSDGTSYIGVATATNPEGPYEDKGIIVEYGTEAIDAFILEDNGELYISWKAYGLDDRPIELLGCKLSDDGLRLEGKPFRLLKDDERRGMEGQQWMKLGEYYYLLYSVNGCCGPNSDYAVSVARSKSLKGPYEKYEGNPILHGSMEVQSCGHGTVTTTPDGRMYYLCHAYLSGDGFFLGRQPILQELVKGDDKWLHFKSGEEASLIQELPFNGTAQQPAFDFEDDFSDPTLKAEWTWNYPYATPHIRIEDGCLSLSGTPKKNMTTGVALCLRPTKTNYTLETALVKRNNTLQGITIYGDNDNYQLLGIENNIMRVTLTKDGNTEIVSKEIDIPVSASVYLRLEVSKGNQYRFYYSLDRFSWIAVPLLAEKDGNSHGLIRWDRVARPGIYHKGDIDKPAYFEYVTLK